MYNSVFYDKKSNLVHLWDDQIGYEKFQYEPYAYLIDKNGTFTTMDDAKVKRVTTWSKVAESQGLVYEHDVPILTRVLVDRYYKDDSVGKNKVMFLDIEVAKEGKHSTAKAASNTITAISFFLKETGYVCLLLDKRGKLSSGQISVKTTGGETLNVNLQVFKNEKLMLMSFVTQFATIRPTIVSHWNGDKYDMPYLVNRIQGELGREVANRLSQIGIVYTRDIGKRDQVATIAGVSSLDYMNLYKKFSEGDRPRFNLDFIAKLELGRGKKKYVGTLDTLYESDPLGFLEYNIDDVELVVALDKKFGFIDIAVGMCHAGCVPYEDIIFPTRYLEGAALVHCKNHDIVAMRTYSDEIPTKAKGAFVRKPRPGLFRYVCSVDLQSQYPTSIISQNISPETKYGRVVDWDKEEFAKDVVRSYTIKPKIRRNIELFDFAASDSEFIVDNLRQWLTENKMCVSAIGVIYRIDKIGLIPDILTKWFAQRKEFKNLRDSYEENSEMYGYYDRRQYIQKILLNTFYGAMLEHNFRFYDKENGESTTQTGFNLIHFTSNVINHYCRKITGMMDDDFVIYNDTDSGYFILDSVLKSEIDIQSASEDDIINRLQFHSKKIEDLLNQSYNLYALRYHNLATHKWNIKQEKIARTAFWGAAKKRYAMWVIVNEGHRCEKPMIKGFDMVKSSFPQMAREFMEELIIGILKEKTASDLNNEVINFKHRYLIGDLIDILPASSVNEISKYENVIKGVPVHVNAAKNYNSFLRYLKLDDEYPNVEDGDKMMWGYLVQNPQNFNTLAMRGYDDPEEIPSYLEKYADRNQIFESALLSKLQTIWDDLHWGIISLNEDTQDFF